LKTHPTAFRAFSESSLKSKSSILSNDYLNPCTDTAFKRLFGEKSFLINFFNSLAPSASRITDIYGVQRVTQSPQNSQSTIPSLGMNFPVINNIEYVNSEIVGASGDTRQVRYDVTAVTETGSNIILEMQQRGQPFFHHRLEYYLAAMLNGQGPVGKIQHERYLLKSQMANQVAEKTGWRYELTPIYVIALCDFEVHFFPSSILSKC
jgi:hypothetical protein